MIEPLAWEQVALVTGYMKENLAEPIGLEVLAAVTGYSRYHFLRRSKAATGRDSYQYLMGSRIDVALQLLESPGGLYGLGQDCGQLRPAASIFFLGHETVWSCRDDERDGGGLG
ncbi:MULTISPECIES: hypothetical protein [unclassified Streptomyces]|uniref:hypothetical protein n=1 Tax=unclassified Streptomyces TaxID=2593676 RepID=UPI00365A046D